MNGLEHPARQGQGLGQPQAPQSSGAEFYKPNGSLGAYNARQTGERQMELEQAAAQGAQAGAQQGYAQANKEMAQAAVMNQMSKQSPQNMVMGIAQEISAGTSPEALIQQGAPQELVVAAINMLQQQQPQGLGGAV